MSSHRLNPQNTIFSLQGAWLWFISLYLFFFLISLLRSLGPRDNLREKGQFFPLLFFFSSLATEINLMARIIPMAKANPLMAPCCRPHTCAKSNSSFPSYASSMAGKSICQRELKVHCQWDHRQGLPRHSEVLHFPEDDSRGAGGMLHQVERVQHRQAEPRSHDRSRPASQSLLQPVWTQSTFFCNQEMGREWLAGRARLGRRVKLL